MSSDNTKMLLSGLVQILVVGGAAYAMTSPGGAFLSSSALGTYSKYIIPLILGLLAWLLCWGSAKMMSG